LALGCYIAIEIAFCHIRRDWIEDLLAGSRRHGDGTPKPQNPYLNDLISIIKFKAMEEVEFETELTFKNVLLRTLIFTD
jgi:hypothetical protein